MISIEIVCFWGFYAFHSFRWFIQKVFGLQLAYHYIAHRSNGGGGVINERVRVVKSDVFI